MNVAAYGVEKQDPNTGLWYREVVLKNEYRDVLWFRLLGFIPFYRSMPVKHEAELRSEAKLAAERLGSVGVRITQLSWDMENHRGLYVTDVLWRNGRWL